MVDGTGRGIRRSVRLGIRGRHIVRIDEAAAPGTGMPASGRRWRFPGDTVLPGLFDGHLHLAMSAATDAETRRRQLDADDDAAVGGMVRRVNRMLRHGIVAARDAGDTKGHAIGFCRNGMPGIAGPFNLRAAGRGWHAAGRYGRFVGRAPEDGCALADAVRRDNDRGDHLKIINSGLNSLTDFGRQTPPQFTRAVLRDAIAEERRHGRPTMVHANGAAAVMDAVAAGARSIEHGYFMGSAAIQRMADAEVFWVPTVVPMAVHAQSAGAEERDIARRTVDHQLVQVHAAWRAGVRLVVGTDAGGIGVDHGRAVVEEMALFLAAGLPLAAVVRAASGDAARLLGIPDQGELVPGTRACLVVAPGPPEALPHSLARIRLLMIDGGVIETTGPSR